MFSSIFTNLTPISRDHNKKLVKIIQTLLSYQQSNVFRKPIPHKALGWQNYKDIVKKPIDLNLVRRQYNEGKYKTVQEVLDDIQIIWENTFLYGKRQHQSFDMAVRMQKYFDELLSDLYPEYFQKINRVIYFKQFEKKPQKMQRRSSNIQSVQVADKLATKAQKMELQKSRNQMQIQKQANLNKRKQLPPTRRPPGLRQPVINPPKIQIPQKIIEEVQKVVQTTRPVKNMIQVEPSLNPNQVQNIPQNISSISVEQPYDNESEEENRIPPILVNLNQSPNQQQIEQITEMMKILFERQQFQTLSKVVKILTKYQKQNMIIDGEDVNFRMNEIHISTYNRVKKQLQIKIHQTQINATINGKHKFTNSLNNHILQSK